MSFAEGLASSDGPDHEYGSAADGSTPDVSNAGLIAEGAGILSHSHSRQSSISRGSTFSSSPSVGGYSSSSVLGRRQREFGQQAWSPREKVHIRDFASDKCTEYELSATDRDNILKDSEVSPLSLSHVPHHSNILCDSNS